jgi:AhpD family alkylhydroperoxidase
MTSLAPSVREAHESPTPRLAPIDRPPTLLIRLLAWALRSKLGKVMMPLRVIYNRMPRLVFPQLMMLSLAESRLSLDPLLVALVQTRVSIANGCTFCADLHEAYGVKKGLARAKLSAVSELRAEAGFTAAELCALRYADQCAQTGKVDDATFEALREHFSEAAIVELTWLCAFTTYLNRMAVPLGIGSDGFCKLVQ